MHVFSLLLAALAPVTLVNGSPAPGSQSDDMGFIGGDEIVEYVHVKRDVALHARDIHEADKHGVNLKEMHKHSILKRSNGDHVSIWVHNSFNGSFFDDDKRGNNAVDLQRRSLGFEVKNLHPDFYQPGDSKKKCKKSKIASLTTESSPYGYGALAIVRWAHMNMGAFYLGNSCCFFATDLLVAGSNQGGNMRFSVRKEGEAIFLGSLDIAEVTQRAMDKHSKQYGETWRLAAGGKMKCRKAHQKGHKQLWWDISRSDERVGLTDLGRHSDNNAGANKVWTA
ncbi:hypothetical protein IL306_004592 [Fusarium sp. DS 682]|nr:hypothetical protein IL306_004592 [Fusarium sp. DS 682]